VNYGTNSAGEKFVSEIKGSTTTKMSVREAKNKDE